MPITITAPDAARSIGLGERNPGAVGSAHFERLYDAASATVLVYAGPDTPNAILNEAAVRVIGWLLEAAGGNIASFTSAEVQMSLTVSQKGALRHSGARSLLNPWKVRGAYLIAKDDD